MKNYNEEELVSTFNCNNSTHETIKEHILLMLASP